jgi:hypothetical protein
MRMDEPASRSAGNGGESQITGNVATLWWKSVKHQEKAKN